MSDVIIDDNGAITIKSHGDKVMVGKPVEPVKRDAKQEELVKKIRQLEKTMLKQSEKIDALSEQIKKENECEPERVKDGTDDWG